jgi:hypothetical protein
MAHAELNFAQRKQTRGNRNRYGIFRAR